METAIYGKGGIGKSTISANLSAALSMKGRRVLQVGCDPKHDSTRLLHHGGRLETVLDYLRKTPVEDQKLEDVLLRGFGDVGCIEAGGPRPGTGCAGRGILSTFEFLNRYHCKEQYDEIVYDVLGDVVCGGFAVPVRREYADAIFLVTSGEFMSLYAANNILAGIRNYDHAQKRIAGIVYNSRNIAGEESRMLQFAAAVRLPICARIPRSDAFARAEREAVTVVEQDRGSAEAIVFLQLADQIVGGIALHEANPLAEDEMEAFMRGSALRQTSLGRKETAAESHAAPQAEPKQVRPAQPRCGGTRQLGDPFSRVPLYGCAFNGAVALSIHLGGTAVLAHAPKSCMWFSNNGLSAYGRRGLFERGVMFPVFAPIDLEATDIGAQDVVFGGMDHVQEKIRALAARKPKAIVIVTSCIPAITGDDVDSVTQADDVDVPLLVIRADGVSAGDYNKGMSLFYREIARQVIRQDVTREPDALNLVYESVIAANRDLNYRVIKQLLDVLRIRINCRFLCETDYDSVQGFLKAPWSVMARMDCYGAQLKEFLQGKYGCLFLEGTLPTGFRQTKEWVEALAQRYPCASEAQKLIADYEQRYHNEIDRLKPSLGGKRVLFFVTALQLSWLLDLAQDLELEIVKGAVFGQANDDNPSWKNRFSPDWNYGHKQLLEDIRMLKPDLILTGNDFAIEDGPYCVDILPNPPDVGFLAGVALAEKWKNSLEHHLRGAWLDDEAIFAKHFG